MDLKGTSAGDDTVCALVAKPQLAEIFLGNGLTDEGIGLLAEFPVLSKDGGPELGMSLMEGRPRGRLLWISLKSRISNRGLAKLRGLEGLTTLSLFGSATEGPFDSRSTEIDTAGIKELAQLPSLVWLGCMSNLCDDRTMRELGGFERLRFLMCQDAVAGDAGFAALARCRSLEFIWGRRCYNLGASGFRRLAEMPALRGLGVSCKNVKPGGLSALPSFPSLAELMPMDIGDAGFRHIGECPRLSALYCMYCRDTTDLATEQIRGLSQLRTYHAWSTQISDRSFELLSAMPSLERLVFSGCAGLTDAGVAELARLPNLTYVDLERLPNVTAQGAAALPPYVRVRYRGPTDDR